MKTNIGWGWDVHFSKKYNRLYYYNTIYKVSFWTKKEVLTYIGFYDYR